MDSSFVTERLEATCRTFEALERQLADPTVAADPDQLLTLAKERSRLEPLVLDYRQLQSLNSQTVQARDLLREHRNDKELEELAQEELASLESQRLVLEERLRLALLPGGFTIEPGALIPGSGTVPGTERADLREDRNLFYLSLHGAEEVSINYSLRAVCAGDFVVPPLFAESMYDRGINGRGLSARITVVPRE